MSGRPRRDVADPVSIPSSIHSQVSKAGLPDPNVRALTAGACSAPSRVKPELLGN